MATGQERHALQQHRQSVRVKKRTTRFRLWIIIISLSVAGTVTVLAALVAIGIQRHNDQQLAAQMIRSEVELQTTGARISGIKDHEFKTMAEYVDAYVQIAPLHLSVLGVDAIPFTN